LRDPQDGGDSNAKHWSCVAWPAPPAPCPTPRPLVGSACDVEGTACNYAVLCSAVSFDLPNLKCVDGRWQSQRLEVPPCAAPVCQ
jgi:hypothetical protein